MALLRLCYAADLPSPSDALKALQNGQRNVSGSGAAPAGAPASTAAPRGSGATALAAQPVSAAAAQPAAATPSPKGFTDVVALFETRREARLVHHPLRIDGLQVLDARRVLDSDRRNYRERVTTH